MTDSSSRRLPGSVKPSPAGLYAEYLGGQTGKDAYPADTAVARQMAELGLDRRLIARSNRAFHNRSVRVLTSELGIGQILDIGTGLPSAPNTHEIAQAVIESARVVYVDNDPRVLAHAAALLASGPAGATDYVSADLCDPAAILDAARRTLDFDEPIAVLLIAVLHFVRDSSDPHRIVQRLMRGLPAGSALVYSHMTSEYAPQTMRQAEELLRGCGQSAQIRDRAAITAFADGLILAEPGVVPVHQWRQHDAVIARTPPEQVHLYGALALKRSD